MENTPNLNRKLLELQKSVRGLKKDKKGFGYDYVSGDKLLGFIRPKMDELGLLLIPNTEGVEQQMIETVPQTTNRDGSIKPAKNEIYVLLHKTFTWVDTESGESITTHFYSQAANSFDKSIGSAETYAERYFLLKWFHVATDEDDVDAIFREEATEESDDKGKGKGKGKKGKGSEKPEQVEEQDGNRPEGNLNFLSEDADLQDAIGQAKDAKTHAELTQVWKAWQSRFKDNAKFLAAIKANPNHPSHLQQ